MGFISCGILIHITTQMVINADIQNKLVCGIVLFIVYILDMIVGYFILKKEDEMKTKDEKEIKKLYSEYRKMIKEND